MMTTFLSRASAIVTLVLVTLGAVSCGLERQTAPPLAGPSEFGLSLSMTATPDTIVANGESQSFIRIMARNANGEPASNITVQLSVSIDQLIAPATLTQSTVVTNGNGEATTALIAPPAPATRFARDPVVTISAVPVGVNFADAVSRPLQVRVVAPDGTPNGNRHPVAVIIANPPVANYNETIRFDGSFSTDEGLACGENCQYIWEFGDNTVAIRGITADHAFALPGDYTVTLTVTDGSGGVGVATTIVRIIGPSAPVANFTVTPTSPIAGATATFNASSSTVGSGATITQYAWDFGDGSATEVSGSASIGHAFAAQGTYLVTLTVTDSLGRQSTRFATVTVRP